MKIIGTSHIVIQKIRWLAPIHNILQNKEFHSQSHDTRLLMRYNPIVSKHDHTDKLLNIRTVPTRDGISSLPMLMVA
jgi:hypothetical protein